MRRRRAHITIAATLAVAGGATAVALVAGTAASGSPHHPGNVRATLTGFQEVPSLNTEGKASLRIKMTASQLTFVLTYSGLSGPPSAAHVHVGQRGVSGGVSVFFCGGGGKPACPAAPSGTVTGTITAADVIGPTAQGFNAGDLAALERAIKAGVTYANMHTAKFPAGELRGQLEAGHGGEH